MSVYSSPHAALAHSVQAAIVGMIGNQITGVAADSVRVRKVPYAQDFAAPIDAHALPGILIVYFDRERDQGGVNDRDDIGFPILVVFVAKDVDAAGRSDTEDNDDTYLTWRQAISDMFRNQPYQITNYAKGAVTFQTCELEYGPIVDWSRWQKDQLFVGSFTLVFTLRKARGANPFN